jgi:hypothetical protein
MVGRDFAVAATDPIWITTIRRVPEPFCDRFVHSFINEQCQVTHVGRRTSYIPRRLVYSLRSCKNLLDRTSSMMSLS